MEDGRSLNDLTAAAILEDPEFWCVVEYVGVWFVLQSFEHDFCLKHRKKNRSLEARGLNTLAIKNIIR